MTRLRGRQHAFSQHESWVPSREPRPSARDIIEVSAGEVESELATDLDIVCSGDQEA